MLQTLNLSVFGAFLCMLVSDPEAITIIVRPVFIKEERGID